MANLSQVQNQYPESDIVSKIIKGNTMHCVIIEFYDDKKKAEDRAKQLIEEKKFSTCYPAKLH